MSYDKDAETVSLEFGCELEVGEVTISITYEGHLNDQMRGFYRFKYTVNGEDRYGAATQFEVLIKFVPLKSFLEKTYIPSCIVHLFSRLLRLVEPCLVGMSQLTRPHMISLLLFPKIGLLFPIW